MRVHRVVKSRDAATGSQELMQAPPLRFIPLALATSAMLMLGSCSGAPAPPAAPVATSAAPAPSSAACVLRVFEWAVSHRDTTLDSTRFWIARLDDETLGSVLTPDPSGTTTFSSILTLFR